MRTRSVIHSSLALGAAALTLAAGHPAQAQQASTPLPFTVTGNVEASYSYNFNGGSSTGLYWNNDNGAFALNLADLQLSRAANDQSRAGFFVRVIGGEAERYLFGDDADGGIRILEAYGTFLAPVGGKDLKIDAGQFVTPIGYEKVEIGTQSFITKGWLFLAEPRYHQGLRAAYPFSGKLTGSLYLVNAFQGDFDYNKDIAPGLSFSYRPSDSTSWTFNALHAYQYGGSSTLLNVVGEKRFSPGFKGALEGLYRWDDSGSDNGDTWGLGLYGIFSKEGGNVFAARADYLHSDAYFFGDDAHVGSVSLSFEPVNWTKKLSADLRTLLELRYDYSDDTVFDNRHDIQTKKNQLTLTIGETYHF